MGSDGDRGFDDSPSLPLTSCCPAHFLRGRGPVLVCGPYPELETEGGTNQPSFPRSQCRVVLKSPGIGASTTKQVTAYIVSAGCEELLSTLHK